MQMAVNVAREVCSAGERELLLLTIRLHALRYFPQLCDVREANGKQQGRSPRHVVTDALMSEA
jgi:hypothetical protein